PVLGYPPWGKSASWSAHAGRESGFHPPAALRQLRSQSPPALLLAAGSRASVRSLVSRHWRVGTKPKPALTLPPRRTSQGTDRARRVIADGRSPPLVATYRPSGDGR